MKDTFKKFGKDAVDSLKNETANAVTDVTNKATGKSEPSFGSNLAKKAMGTGDILEFKSVDSIGNNVKAFLHTEETVYFYLESVYEHIVVTNRGIISSLREGVASSKSTISRIDFKTTKIDNLYIETAGTIDRDAELKYSINGEKVSLDIHKSQLDNLFKLYHALANVCYIQNSNQLLEDNLKLSLDLAKDSISSHGTNGVASDYQTICEYAEGRLNGFIKTDYSEAFE